MGVMSTVAHNSWIWIMAEYQEKTSWHWDLLGCGIISHGKWWKSHCLRSEWAPGKGQILAWPQSSRANELIVLTYDFLSIWTVMSSDIHRAGATKAAVVRATLPCPVTMSPLLVSRSPPGVKKKKGWLWVPPGLSWRITVLASWKPWLGTWGSLLSLQLCCWGSPSHLPHVAQVAFGPPPRSPPALP